LGNNNRNRHSTAGPKQPNPNPLGEANPVMRRALGTQICWCQAFPTSLLVGAKPLRQPFTAIGRRHRASSAWGCSPSEAPGASVGFGRTSSTSFGRLHIPKRLGSREGR